MSFWSWVFIIYVAGLFYFSYKSISSYITCRDNEKVINYIKFYLIFKPLLWPYFLFLMTNPLKIISQLFFRHYGVGEHGLNCGTRGLRYFLNDIFHGKKRHISKNYNIEFFERLNNIEINNKNNSLLEILNSKYCELIYHIINNNKVAMRIYCYEDPTEYRKLEDFTRYELDDLAIVSWQAFIKEIAEINDKVG